MSGGSSSSTFGAPGDPPLGRGGDEIIIAGRFYPTGTKVVTWLDPGGCNAYACTPPLPARGAPGAPPDLAQQVGDALICVPRFGERKTTPRNLQGEQRAPDGGGSRDNSENGGSCGNTGGGGGGGGDGGGGDSGGGNNSASPASATTTTNALVTTVAALESVLNTIVVHYDGCGTSARCFEVLHSERGLSCHFLIDGDGTVYQTLDVMERAWHATTANDASVGVELAHWGALPPPRHPPSPKTSGPEGEAPGSPDSDSFPLRRTGTIQGQELHQMVFDDRQYDALARIAATLMARFPAISNSFPRRPLVVDTLKRMFDSHFPGAGDVGQREMYLAVCARDPTVAVVPHKLPDDELAVYRGVLGHYHVQANKIDPGPAFEWERLHAQIGMHLARRAGTQVFPLKH